MLSSIIDHGLAESLRCGITQRSHHWHSVEKAFRTAHPFCAACNPLAPIAHIGLQVHHIRPFHICIMCGRPDLELDPRNLVTLGETEHDSPAPNHHLLLGHLDDFKSYNADVVADCRLFMNATTEQIRADARWLAKARGRPGDAWTPEQIAAFKLILDRDLPPDPKVMALLAA